MEAFEQGQAATTALNAETKSPLLLFLRNKSALRISLVEFIRTGKNGYARTTMCGRWLSVDANAREVARKEVMRLATEDNPATESRAIC